MKKSDITEAILKALEGKEMDYIRIYRSIGYCKHLDYLDALTTLTESGQIVCDNGRYKIKENKEG